MATQQRCAACSTKVLTSFLASCGTRIRPTIPPTRRLLTTISTTSRQFSTSTYNAAADSKKDPNVALPWFLRVETPKAPKHPLAAKQELPKLPENPPTQLEDIINQMADGNGITELKLYDLRTLDPPPALGTNVIMLIGTARWKPYADGLLGRNELKLINRRKQRRGKVASSQVGEVDEAGNSGWVCVHSGKEGIVIQIMTQEKRDELNIDGLWGDVTGRWERHMIAEAARKEERLRQATLAAELEGDEAGDAVMEEGAAADAAEPAFEVTAEEAAAEEIEAKEEGVAAKEEEGGKEELVQQTTNESQRSQYTVSGPQTQTRSFSTFLRRLSAVAETIPPASETIANPETPAAPKPAFDLVSSPHFPTFTQTGDLKPLLATLPTEQHLSTHFTALPFLPISAVGTGLSDTSSTPFLRTFYACTPSSADTLRLHLRLNALAPERYPIQQIVSNHPSLPPAHLYLLAHHIALCPELRPAASEANVEAANVEAAAAESRHTLLLSILPETPQAIPEFRYTLFLSLLPFPPSQLTLSFPLDPRITELYSPIQRATTFTRPDYTIRDHHRDYILALGYSRSWTQLQKFWKRLPAHDVDRDRGLGDGEGGSQGGYLGGGDMARGILGVVKMAEGGVEQVEEEEGAPAREWSEVKRVCKRVIARQAGY
ncbi:Similar to ATPase synthesis protein 25, mitochondrial; acc. no. C5PDQ4 [Pyronema omphalodes CBS 100304]|uniref:ATPase synthesis protein 25 n=1 Tax=Pyronema omphalodes (strain CBS 100304) TaxID=1076935 RepID=U4LB31_PYROM|nr:Similar to ATPase synthesis protein 25, mitochondrial; acc. no. C5PDQ4 [Pyronema omphalodes CBS 100304]